MGPAACSMSDGVAPFFLPLGPSLEAAAGGAAGGVLTLSLPFFTMVAM